jgi:trans-2,3-dihydro-3-hydroxyanthranilate isomerase
MKPRDFTILDVFAEEKYTGNQLAVVTDAADLSTQEMLQITREFHFSETTFILAHSDTGNGYPVRIFTPAEEVPFAGHPTIGTAWAIRNLLNEKQPQHVTLDLKIGSITVSFSGDTDIGWMTTQSPSFSEPLAPDQLTHALQLPVDAIDTRFPVQVVSTGLPALIVPVTTLDYLQQARVHTERLSDLARQESIGKCQLVFCPETLSPDNQLHVRVFCTLVDIPEDPATGSANSCLAGYLVTHQYFDTQAIDISVEQGHEIQRPSRLYLKASVNDDTFSIQVGGKVCLVAKGQLL